MCPSCGVLMPLGKSFCTQCGASLSNTEMGPAVPAQNLASSRRRRLLPPVAGNRKIVFVLVGVVAATSSGVFLLGAWISSAGSMDWMFGQRFSKEDVATAYDKGYSSGENSGYSNGYSAGESAGKSSGYDDGYAAGESAGKSSGYDDGYAAGESAGKSSGYDDGYSAGERTGYNNGVTAGCRSVFTSISSATGYSAIVAWDSSYRRVRGSQYYTSSDLCD
jgi:hypothetical protein